KVERRSDWLKKGAQPSDRVARFLAQEGLVKWEHGNNPNKGKPGKKAEERAAEKAQRDADAAEAAAAAKADAEAAAAAAAAAPPPEPEPAPEPEAAPAEEAPTAEAAAEEAAPAAEET